MRRPVKMPKYQKGGDIKKSYNPNLAEKDKDFQDWYSKNTLEGKSKIPFSDKLDYDYYSMYKNGDNGSVENHFPDTYKRPNHKTFSNESIYSTPENKGGSWKNDKFIPEFGWGGGISGGLNGGLQGALAGSTFGPLGTIIGAGAGLAYGAFTGSNQQDKEQEMLRQQQVAASQQAMINSPHMYMMGGGVYNRKAGLRSVINNNSSKMGYFEDGGEINDKSEIEVQGSPQGGELEVSKGKIIKDFKGKPMHKDGGYSYKATPGNNIIPNNMRTKYLEGDKQTRNTIEIQLRRDQQKRDMEELNKFRNESMERMQHPTSENPNEDDGTINSNNSLRDPGQMGSTGIYKQARFSKTFKNGGKVYAEGGFIEDVNNQKKPLGFEFGNDNYSLQRKNIFQLPTSNNNEIQGFGNINNPILKNTNQYSNKIPDINSNNDQTAWNKYAKLGAASAPIAYDLGMYAKGPDYLNPENFQNPYEGQTRRLMANRSINMKPVTDRILNGRQTSLDNAKNSQAMSGGAYLSNASQIGASTQQNLADAEMKAQEANNRYRGEEAGTLAGLGSERARTNLGVQDMNMRSKAATNNFLGSAARGVSTIGQGQVTDDQKANALKYLFGEDNANDLLNYYTKRKGAKIG